MEYSKDNNGWCTFHEHLGLPLMILPVLAFFFFENLRGEDWIQFFVLSRILLFLGAALLTYAKLPVYLAGRFFTFEIRSVPPHRVGFYRWGWGVFLVGAALSLCLLLSRQ